MLDDVDLERIIMYYDNYGDNNNDEHYENINSYF